MVCRCLVVESCSVVEIKVLYYYVQRFVWIGICLIL